MMKTTDEVIKFLVERGVPQNFAKASVHEAYRSDAPADDHTNRLYGYDIDCTKAELTVINQSGALLMHSIVFDALCIAPGNKGICVFGELKYDMNGDLLK